MDRKPEKYNVIAPSIEETCKKCWIGNLISPYNASCAKYKIKPKEIFIYGEDCPYMIIDDTKEKQDK